MDQFPSRQSIDLLRELGITYVVVDMSAYGDFRTVEGELLRNGLVLQTEQREYRVYSFDQ